MASTNPYAEEKTHVLFVYDAPMAFQIHFCLTINMSLISLLIIHLARVAFSHIIRTFALATCWVEHFSCKAEISQCTKWRNAKLLICCQEGHNLLKFGGLHNEVVAPGRLLGDIQ